MYVNCTQNANDWDYRSFHNSQPDKSQNPSPIIAAHDEPLNNPISLHPYSSETTDDDHETESSSGAPVQVFHHMGTRNSMEDIV